MVSQYIMVYTGNIYAEQWARVCFLKENTRLSLREIAWKCDISKSSVTWICDRTSNQRSQVNNVSRKSGQRRKISERDGPALIQGLQRVGLRSWNVTVKTVVKDSGCSFQQAHRRTFSCFQNEKGHGYLIARRKGILSEKDQRRHLQYAREMKRGLSRNPDVFKHDIAFYLDGVSFVHRQNPLQAAATAKSRIKWKKNEGLQFTGKGSKDLAGGPRLHLIVAIT